MKRTLISALAMTLALAGEAAAEVDPINWCPDGLSVPVAQPSERLEQAVRVVRTTWAEGAFYPTARVASVELQSLPARAIASARSDLGLRAGVSLTPNWIVRSDVLDSTWPVYCAPTEPWRSSNYTPGVCVSDVVAETNIARSAFHAGLGEPFPRRPLMWGRSQMNQRGLGRNQDWAVLGAPGEPPAPFSRSLNLGAIHITRTPAISAWNRRAFNDVSVQFVLEGYEAFFRGLNEPIRIEGGDLLAITEVSTSGEVSIQRMTEAQWQAFQRTKCDNASSAG